MQKKNIKNRLLALGLLAPMFISSLSVLLVLYPPNTAQALNGFIDPNGDGSIGSWTSTGATHYTEIDDAARQPALPNTLDRVSGSANNGGSLNQRMTTIQGAVLVTDITVWIYHNDGTNGLITVQLYDDNETTARSGTANVAQSATNAWHSVTFSGLSLSQLELNTLTIRMSTDKSGGGSPATINIYSMYADVTYSAVTPVFQQSGYRLFNNGNSTDVGTPLAAQDTGGVLNAAGDAFRLRLLLHITTANLAQNGETFKLQFVDRGSGSCSSPSGGSPATYTDITTSTVIAYNNLSAGVNDGDALTANANDPVHSGHASVNQSVEEGNNFTNAQAAINVGQDGKWDFALMDNGAPAATTYCFRAVLSNNTLLNTYSLYPQITTGNGVLSVDIVNASDVPVASPSFSMSSSGYLFTCDTSTTSIGTQSQQIKVSNYTGTASWSVSAAVTNGSTANWSNGSGNFYDFNDPSGPPAGCLDGADGDSVAGQLRLNPAVATVTPRSGCTNNGVSLGGSGAYHEGATDSIVLIVSDATTQLGCAWYVTGIDAAQNIPSDQSAGNYQINITITAAAI